MAGQPFYLNMPSVLNVKLKGKLRPWVSAKDVILEVLRQLTVKGGVGKVVEYSGSGVKSLSVPERATITNMGAELGATTSIFPSDDVTKKFLTAQKRGKSYKQAVADDDAAYEEQIEIDLSKLEPLMAQPHMPDNIIEVKKLKGIKVSQVAIGSCTNSSYRDMMTVAAILKGKTINPGLSLGISPGSKQVFDMISKVGATTELHGAFGYKKRASLPGLSGNGGGLRVKGNNYRSQKTGKQTA